MLISFFKKQKKILYSFLSAFLLFTGIGFAIPILNMTTSDTSISVRPSESAIISYTVQNNTSQTLSGIRYLAPPLTQVSSTLSTCQTTLASNATCNLSLIFTAPSTLGDLLLDPLTACVQNTVCSSVNRFNRTRVNINSSSTTTVEEFYILDFDGDTVKVLDSSTDTITHTITVGTNPSDIAFNSDASRAYVTNQGDNTVSVIDTSTYTVISTIPGITTPRKIVLTPDDSKAYIQPNGAGNIQVITLSNEAVSAIAISSIDIALNLNGSILYSITNNINLQPYRISLIETAGDTVSQVVQIVPFGVASTSTRLALTPNGSFLVINPGRTTTGVSRVYFLNTTNNAISNAIGGGLNLSGSSNNVLGATDITSTSSFAWVGLVLNAPLTTNTGACSALYNFNTQTFQGNAVCDRAIYAPPTINPENTKGYYVFNGNSGSDVYVISTETGDTIQAEIPVGIPTGVLSRMAFVSDGTRAYITARDSNAIVIFDTVNDIPSSIITDDVGLGPSVIVAKP